LPQKKARSEARPRADFHTRGRVREHFSVHPTIKPYLVIATGIVAVSFASIFIRLAEAPSLVIAASRLTIASLILAPAALIRGKDELRSLTRGDVGLALLSGLFLGLHFATWISSLEYTSVASSVVFVDTSPLFVGLASHLLLKERVSRQMFAGIAVSVLGGIIIGFGDFGLGARELLGDLLALAGAVAVSGYLLVGRKLRRHLSLLLYIFLVYATAAVFLVAVCLIAGHTFSGYPQQTYLMFILLAVVPQIIGHSSYNWALKYLPATFVGVGTLGEPIGSTILAYFFLSEVPTPAKIGGGVLILAGIYVSSRAEGVTGAEG
jgi:drug/metabolite transporter (DMT)-like permease